MPDIAMCDGSMCSSRMECYRHRAKPSYRQSMILNQHQGGTNINDCDTAWKLSGDQQIMTVRETEEFWSKIDPMTAPATQSQEPTPSVTELQGHIRNLTNELERLQEQLEDAREREVDTYDINIEMYHIDVINDIRFRAASGDMSLNFHPHSSAYMLRASYTSPDESFELVTTVERSDEDWVISLSLYADDVVGTAELSGPIIPGAPYKMRDEEDRVIGIVRFIYL